MSTSDWIQILGIAGILIGIYVKMVTKQAQQDMKIDSLEREYNMKILALEKDFEMMQKYSDKIMDKLEEITDSLTSLKIQIQNKQDRL